MDPETRISPLSEEDLDEVLRLERECFSDPWSREAFRQEIRSAGRGGISRVVREAGTLVAYSVAWFVADEGHLANIAVAPDRRRRGLARLLLGDFIEEGRHRGSRHLWLEVRVSNRPAIRLYEDFGFLPISIRKGYYSRGREDALVMRLELENEGGNRALVQDKERRPSTSG